MNRVHTSPRAYRFVVALVGLAVLALVVWWRSRSSETAAAAPRVIEAQPAVLRSARIDPPSIEAPAVAEPAPAPAQEVAEAEAEAEAEVEVEVEVEAEVEVEVEPAAKPVEIVLKGTFVDDARRPIANADCFAAPSSWKGDRPPLVNATTDRDGVFRFAKLSVGSFQVSCRQGDYMRGRADVTLTATTTPLEIVSVRDTRRARAGMTLEDHDTGTEYEVRVASLEPGGPAARAGLAIGDRIVSVNGRDFRGGGRSRFLLRHIEIRPRDQAVQLGIVRAGRDLQLAMTLPDVH